MPQHTIIEIAGVKMGIAGMEVSPQLDDFVSRGTPDLDIICHNQSHQNPVSDKVQDEGRGWDIAISNHNGVWEIASASTAGFPIGRIHADGGKAEFNNYSPALSSIFFPPFLRTCFQLALAQSGGLSLHACGIIWQGKGYLFVGPSGSGKTTVASLRPAAAVLLSDEYIALKKTAGGFIMHPTPWRKSENLSGRLDVLFVLQKAKDISFDKLSAADLIAQILPNVLYNADDSALMIRLLDTVAEISRTARGYRMNFPIDRLLWEKIRAREADKD